MGNFKTKNKGFTLIEMLVVLFIVSLLATSGLVILEDARAKARDARRMADMNQVQLAVYFYYDNHEYYPITGVSLDPTVSGWAKLELAIIGGPRPLMAEFPQDPTNEDPYLYKYASNGTEYVMQYTSEQGGARVLRGW